MNVSTIISSQLLQWEWFANSNMVHIWIYFLLKASCEERKWNDIPVPEGSFITSLSEICKDTGITPQKVKTCIRRLKSSNKITITTTNQLTKQLTIRYSVITICDYDDYKLVKNETNQAINQPTNQQNNQPTIHPSCKVTDEGCLPNEDCGESASRRKITYPEEFESDYGLYGRKGSKLKAYKRWSRLTEDDRKAMRIHIPFYLQSNDRQYLKDFEGYINQRVFEAPVYRKSTLLYDPATLSNDGDYMPKTDGFFNYWDAGNNRLIMSNSDVEHLDDGYNSENRPDGATVYWNGYTWKWSKEQKKWIKQ